MNGKKRTEGIKTQKSESEMTKVIFMRWQYLYPNTCSMQYSSTCARETIETVYMRMYANQKRNKWREREKKIERIFYVPCCMPFLFSDACSLHFILFCAIQKEWTHVHIQAFNISFASYKCVYLSVCFSFFIVLFSVFRYNFNPFGNKITFTVNMFSVVHLVLIMCSSITFCNKLYWVCIKSLNVIGLHVVSKKLLALFGDLREKSFSSISTFHKPTYFSFWCVEMHLFRV